MEPTSLQPLNSPHIARSIMITKDDRSRYIGGEGPATNATTTMWPQIFPENDHCRHGCDGRVGRTFYIVLSKVVFKNRPLRPRGSNFP